MNILLEMDYVIRKNSKNSILKYLPEYLSETKKINEAQYKEILTVILTEATPALTALKNMVGGFEDKVKNLAKIAKANPGDMGAARNLKNARQQLFRARLKLGKEALKFKNLADAAKKTKIGQAVSKNPKTAGALATGAVAAGGLMKYASSRKRKQAAAKKLGIKQ